VNDLSKHRVLVTGSAGRIGQGAVAALVQRGHFVRGFDLGVTRGATESVVANLTDYEAILARLNGKQRVILASSGQVNWHQHYAGPFPLRVNDALTPRYWYAVTKIFAEFAGKVYSETHGMDVVAVRLGACPRDRESVARVGNDDIARDVYLSPADAGRFFAGTVEATAGFGFQPVYVCGKSIIRDVFDLEPAKRLFGYEPHHRWPEGLPAEIYP
jgi:nucleoside-diphosphate-sugar epimerase